MKNAGAGSDHRFLLIVGSAAASDVDLGAINAHHLFLPYLLNISTKYGNEQSLDIYTHTQLYIYMAAQGLPLNPNHLYLGTSQGDAGPSN